MANRFRVNILELSGVDISINKGDLSNYLRHDGLFANPVSGYITTGSADLKYYSIDNPNNYSTSGNLYNTGSYLYNTITGFSGLFNTSGYTLQNEINTLTTNLTSTGQQVYLNSNPSGFITNFNKGITVSFDGGGTALTTGVKTYIPVPFSCNLQKWTLFADQAGSMVIDIWKNTYASFPPTSANTITGTPPNLSSVNKNQSTTLTNWTTSINSGDILAFVIKSTSTVTFATLQLEVR